MTADIFPLYIICHSQPPHDDISVCRLNDIRQLEQLAECFTLTALGFDTAWQRRRRIGCVAGFDQTPVGERATGALSVIGQGLSALLAIRAARAKEALCNADLWTHPAGDAARQRFELAALANDDIRRG